MKARRSQVEYEWWGGGRSKKSLHRTDPGLKLRLYVNKPRIENEYPLLVLMLLLSCAAALLHLRWCAAEATAAYRHYSVM